MRAKYLGLDLPSPIIVSSSPYTSNVKSVEQCAASGAGAVAVSYTHLTLPTKLEV